MRYVSIDIETTGLDPDRHQVLEVGAVYDNGSALDDLPVFRCLIQHDTIVGDISALIMNAELLAEINTYRLDKAYSRWIGGTHSWICKPTRFRHLFKEWLDELKVVKPVLAGKNVARFDLPFLERLGFVPHHRRILDPAVLYIKSTDIVPPNLATCLERAGLPNEVTHRAVDDAMQVVRLLRGRMYAR